MALTDNQRRIVEGTRSSKTLRVISDGNGYYISTIVADKIACHEIAIALQNYFNRLNIKKQDQDARL